MLSYKYIVIIFLSGKRSKGAEAEALAPIFKMGFITVNGRILDLAEYKKEVSALRFELAYELQECLAKYGFEIANKKFGNYGKLSLKFINNNLGISLEINMKNYTTCIKNRNIYKKGMLDGFG